MTVDSFPNPSAEVLNGLDPLSRALLDLSVQRGMDDAEIAQVLGTDEASVFEVRVGLLRNLAEQVAPEHAEADLPELEAAVAAELYPAEPDAEQEEAPDEVEAAAEAETPEEAAPEDEAGEDEAEEHPEDEDEAEAKPEPAAARAKTSPAWAGHEPTMGRPRERKRRSPLLILLPLLLVAAVAVVIIVLAGGGDDEGSENTQPPAQQASQPDEPKPEEPEAGEQPKPTRLAPLGSGNATGTATVDGDRVTLKVRKLPAAGGATYTVWLYNSIIDAQRVGTLKAGKATVKLPSGASDYRYLDVSREPADGNANHGGQSVMRVELKKLQP